MVQSVRISLAPLHIFYGMRIMINYEWYVIKLVAGVRIIVQLSKDKRWNKIIQSGIGGLHKLVRIRGL